MPEEQRKVYPSIPEKHWWTLRNKFIQGIPTKVTPGYLATLLGMKEKSASTNIIPSLVMLGLIDDQGVPQPLARRWRNNEEYPAVCQEMRDAVYPEELTEAQPGPSVDGSSVEAWFGRTTGVGLKMQRRCRLVYQILSSGSLPQKNERTRTTATPEPAGEKQVALVPPDFESTIHITIQIHVSPDMKPDQIDQIFASMAKHL